MIPLNDAQRAAVAHSGGPALVLAGAGTGKTRVIVERIRWLISEAGIPARSVLAVTFTNKAAGEMRSRVAAAIGSDRLDSWIGTFHSFGLYVLRRDIDKLDRPRSFTVFDDTDQLSLMKRLVRDLPKSDQIVSPREALSWISRHKQDLTDPVEDDSVEPGTEVYRRLWTAYHRALAGAGAVDFDDLLVFTGRLLETFPEVCRRYQDRFRHVLIDEYQDTNRAQYRIARALCADGRDLFVVGDEDQGIYSWRGASIRNILDFQKDFPNTTIYRLEQNYRSTKPILAIANAVVAKNTQRLGKSLWTTRMDGAPPRYFEAADAEEEARFVADDIVRRGLSPRQVAVLFRTNHQSRLVEEALRRKGLAYVVVGGVRFYARKEIKDVLSYLRLLVNPADDISLLRILNVPLRGIGATTQSRLEEYARERQKPLFEVLREVEHDETLPARVRNGLHDFVRLVDDLARRANLPPVVPIVEELLARTGYRDYLRLADEKDFRTRMENVEEFLTACASFDARGEGTLAEFLQELALLTDADEWDDTLPAVTLMTCHSAKGLEFDAVYLIGLEEGLFPHASAGDSPEEIEEERRLCYVAMTRARNDLTLCAARNRLQYGVATDRAVSSFLQDIPANLVQPVDTNGRPRAGTAATPGAGMPGPETKELRMGTPVWHARFGKGVVLYTSGNGEKLRARVRFQSGRSMNLMVRMAPLKILDGDTP